ncbi:MAG: flavin reductase family protein [Novosphingobium sp.]|nr:flavin reductase family protein [Novosphingobium sp.]
MLETDVLEAFQDTMRHIAAPVFAITTRHQGQRYGIIATAFSSVSFDPPSLLTCVNKDTSIHDPMMSADLFCVNVLGNINRDVADCFAMKKGDDRFSVGEWIDQHDMPVLANAQSSLVCRTRDRHRFGSHTIFVGEVIAARHRDNAKPLTYYNRRYIDISQAPDLA